MIKRVLSFCLAGLLLTMGLTSCADDPAKKEPTEQTQPGGNGDPAKKEPTEQTQPGDNGNQNGNQNQNNSGEEQLHPEHDPIADDLPLWN